MQKKKQIASAPKLSPEDRLEQFPDDKRDFYASIFEERPVNFEVFPEGFALPTQDIRRPSPPICTLFRVKALVEHKRTKKWERLIELVNPRGELVECILPSGVLDGKPREAIARLSDSGFRLFSDYRIPEILQMIRTWPTDPSTYLHMTEQVGWTPDREAFILPTGRCITKPSAPSQYRLSLAPTGQEIGTLDEWRSGVSRLAVGNPNMLFAVSLAFSTPLLPFTNLRTTIFHLFQRTSMGKTRVLETALSVWPKVGDETKTWDMTKNGLEGEIARSNNIFFGLDELPKDASTELGNMIYKVSLGTGKGRAKKDGSAQDRSTWKTAILSTGENSMVQTMNNLGKTVTGGQGVRMIDIPANGRHGVFDELHGHSTSDGFIDELENLLPSASGPAGSAFVEKLIAYDTVSIKRNLASAMSDPRAILQEHLGIVAGDGETNEISRVINFFALIAAAGEMASTWEITGWSAGAATDATKLIAERWLTYRGKRPLDQTQAIKKIRDYIAHLEPQFVPLMGAKPPRAGEAEPAGYQDDSYFYVISATLTRLHKEQTQKDKEGGTDTLAKLMSRLNDAGFLAPGGEKNSLQFKLPKIGNSRPRTYRILRKILEEQSDRDVGPTPDE